jgi:hypothetical protein
MKKIAQPLSKNQNKSDIIGQIFIDSFAWSGKRVVRWTKDNPIVSMENLINGKQKKIYHKAGIIEEGYFNELWQLDWPWEAKRISANWDVQVWIFENGKLIDWNTIKKNQPKDVWSPSKKVDNEIPTLEISSIIEWEKPADGVIIQWIDYAPHDVVDIEGIVDSDYWSQKQQDDYRNKKQQEEDEFLNDMIINNAGADILGYE